MIVVDTSAIVADLREGKGRLQDYLKERFPGRDRAVAGPTALEIYAGARDAAHWHTLKTYLKEWKVVNLRVGDWNEAGRIYYELRRRGITVRGKIDCCVAQAAIARGATLLHRDRDFEKIADIRPLSQEWLG